MQHAGHITSSKALKRMVKNYLHNASCLSFLILFKYVSLLIFQPSLHRMYLINAKKKEV